MLAGLMGCGMDSLLGATLQYSGVDGRGRVVGRPAPGVVRVCGADVLSNDAVNALAGGLTAAAAAAAAARLWR